MHTVQLVLGILVIVVMVVAIIRSRHVNQLDKALQLVRKKQASLAKKQQKLKALEADIIGKQQKK